MSSFHDFLTGGSTTNTKTKPASTGSFSDFLKASDPAQTQAPSPKPANKIVAPVGGVPIKVPSGNIAYKTPSGSIWEYLPDGTRQVTLADQFGGGVYSVNPDNADQIINKGHTTYGGVSAQPGMNRDDIIPVSLGGVNADSKNIKVVPADQNPAELETRLQQAVKDGKMTLAQARLQIMQYKQNGYSDTQPSTFKNFISSIPGALKTAFGFSDKSYAENPVYSVTKQFTSPSPTEQKVEKSITQPSNPIGKVLTEIPATLAKGFVRFTEPAIEALGTQIGTAIGTHGQVLPSGPEAFSAGSNAGLALGGLADGVNELFGDLTDRLVNKTSTIRLTPDDLITKLENNEIQTPAGQAYAQHLIDNNQSIEVTGVEGRGGVAERVGKALGGQEKAPNTVVKIIQENGPVKPSVSESVPQLNAPQTPQNAPGEAIAPKAGASPELSYNPIEQPQIQTPEIKTSKLAQGVEEKAIAQKLTDGFQGLPEYARVNVADQAKAASDLLTTSPEKAISIAMGHELPPEGVLPESVFVAVENHAIQTKNVDLLRQLATSSSLPTEATGMGQRIRMLAERDPNSAVTAMQKVMKIKEEAATKKYGDLTKVKQKIKNQIKTEIKKAAPKANDWSGFLEELKCK